MHTGVVVALLGRVCCICARLCASRVHVHVLNTPLHAIPVRFWVVVHIFFSFFFLLWSNMFLYFRYFDAIGGIYTSSLGHQHPPIVEAAKAQLDKMTFVPPMHAISDVTLDFIEKLGSVTPGDLNFVKAFNSASEATECALKWTRSYHKLTGNPGKYKFISRWDSWHGATAGALAASGGASRKSPHEPHMAGFLKVPHLSMYRDRQPWSFEECNRHLAQMIEDIIVQEDPDTIAGVIMEPIMNTGGTTRHHPTGISVHSRTSTGVTALP